ncbi:MAG TPA: hypothetical protein PLC42_04665 [Parachlamydiaceae bacterium]|nr:hypothetical protein [Parachlamydiaceae bacterium]
MSLSTLGVTVGYFAITGGQLPRVITKVKVDPRLGVISGAIFGALTILTAKTKGLEKVVTLISLNTILTFPFFRRYYADKMALNVAFGLSGLHFVNLCAIRLIINGL